MQAGQTRIDLLQVHSTLDLLKGLPKNAEASFSFLTTKSRYNWTYGEIEKGFAPELGVLNEDRLVSVSSVDAHSRNHKNFWRGTANSISKRTYNGYVGRLPMGDLAWQKLVPFRVELPFSATDLEKESGWALADAAAFLWPCGWAICLTLRIDGMRPLEELMARISALRTHAAQMGVGDWQTKQTAWNALSSASRWIQERVIQPILQRPISPPVSSSPYSFIAVERPGTEELPKVADMDEGTQRLIYALATLDPAWKRYAVDKIRSNFKETDEYAGSFIYMERASRFFWLPALMQDLVKGVNTLHCYVENTKSAMMMVIALSQFVRLLADQQTGSELKANYPLRDLFSRATQNLEELPKLYKNTNLKRLTADLGVGALIADARSRLV